MRAAFRAFQSMSFFASRNLLGSLTILVSEGVARAGFQSDQGKKKVNAKDPAQEAERFHAGVRTADELGRPVTVGDHDSFAFRGCHVVPNAIGAQEIDVGTAGDDFDIGREFLLAEKDFAAGAVEHDRIENPHLSKVSAQFRSLLVKRRSRRFWLECDVEGFVAFVISANPPRDEKGWDEEPETTGADEPNKVGDTEEWGDQQKDQPQEKLTGTRVFVSAADAEASFAPESTQGNLTPIALGEKQLEEGEHVGAREVRSVYYGDRVHE